MNELKLTLAEYARYADEHSSSEIKAYFYSGAGSGQTLHRNLSDLASVQILPKVLQDLRSGGTHFTKFNQTYFAPIIIAPMAKQTLLDIRGDYSTVEAATALKCAFTLSCQASVAMEDICKKDNTCDLFQMYWIGNVDANVDLAQRAQAAGFKAIVLTVDAPVSGVRDAEIEANLSSNFNTPTPNLQTRGFQFSELTEQETFLFDRLAHALPTWEKVHKLCSVIDLPIYVKGVLHPSDAQMAADVGARGVIISNHGGRVLDHTISTTRALVEVQKYRPSCLDIWVDGGIRRGVDIFKMLALGADAVMLGRPILHGLQCCGAKGVAHVLKLLIDELHITMALCGCPDLTKISQDQLILPDFSL